MTNNTPYTCPPVLFLIFNRADTAVRAMEQLAKVRPAKLFIAGDGPRPDKPGEAELVEKTRQAVMEAVTWDCEVKTLFRDENLGCKLAVSGAIDWFFDQVEEGIILEDDCIADPSFFRFCGELLEYYRDEPLVMTISGNNFQPHPRTEYSYYFSRYMHCWGWASWADRWDHFDLEMTAWKYPARRQKLLDDNIPTKKEQKYWTKIFDRVAEGQIDSWAYIWTYSIWAQNGVNILPEVNLVQNIGFDGQATHTKSNTSEFSIPTQSMHFPLKHPESIKRLSIADRYTYRNNFHRPVWRKVIGKLKSICGF
jgi:hypothetical protein